MSDQTKWPLAYERIRGHWVALGAGLLAAAAAAYWHISGGGLEELLSPAAIVFTILSGVAGYWGARALDWMGR
jgi:hypothetical protein